jgi:hypothetical protein
MQKIKAAIFMLAVMFLFAPTTSAMATDKDEAARLCKFNPRCLVILRSDDGDIYCVRQANGTCIVIICSDIFDCFVFRTVHNPGKFTVPIATAQWLFRKRPTPRIKTAATRIFENVARH